MTQTALPETVAGKFDGTTVMSGGLAYRVYQERGELWAEMPDPDVMMYVVQGGRKLPLSDIPRDRRPVMMSTGSHHYQTYWVASRRYEGLLQTLPLVWLIEDQRWAPRESVFMRGPDDQGRMITQWNHHCIQCHSTAGNPGLDEASGMLKSKVAELGISCEACHGPGEQHSKKQRELFDRFGSALARKADDTIVNPANLDHRRSSQVCGQCHGIFVNRDEFAMQYAREGVLYRPGGDLNQARYYVEHPKANPSPARQADFDRNPHFFAEGWWEDGTILAGGREYTALLGTKCFTKGEMSCLSCHSMHRSEPNDMLKAGLDGSAACVKCHAEAKFTTEIGKHTFHLPASSGSECMNCHMPHTTYALLKAIRSHQISSPNVQSSARHGVPNACNLCHLDKTLSWTQTNLVRRYGQNPVALTREQERVSAAVLWLQKGHAAQRAIAGWHFGWKPAQEASGTNWLAPHAAQLLEDSYGVVRYIGGRSVRTLPGLHDFQFDFLAPEPELRRGKDRVLDIWRKVSRAPLPARAELLFGADGGIIESNLAALLRERDNRSITIKE